MQSIISLIGMQATRDIVERHFPRGDVSFTERGELHVQGAIGAQVKTLVEALTERIVKNFGNNFTEGIFRGIYAKILSSPHDDSELSDVLQCVPNGFLEHEKVKRLSKDELEQKVLQRTKELQELNASLEAKIVERTKELVAANKRLEEANHDLDRLSKAKTDFLSLTSHQLRVPLTVARWGILNLREELAPVLKKEHVSLFENLLINNERMVHLIDNLLNIARIEEGRFVYQFENVVFGNIVAEAVNTLSEFARTKSITLRYEPSGIPFMVRADKEKLYLALENVIDNAVKYTPEGKEVRVTAEKEDAHVLFKVTDQGIGVPKEDWEHIFDKFFRAKNAIGSDANGSGLGLFIVKKIIEDHGGHITFKSEEEKGTTFSIELPAAD